MSLDNPQTSLRPVFFGITLYQINSPSDNPSHRQRLWLVEGDVYTVAGRRRHNGIFFDAAIATNEKSPFPLHITYA